MKKLAAPIAGAGLFLLLAAGAVAAASPAPTAPAVTAPAATSAPAVTPLRATDGTVAAILGLTDAQVMALRQQGLSLAQIAARQNVDPQKLVDALVAQWSVRIDARLAAGAITADQAKTLKANSPSRRRRWSTRPPWAGCAALQSARARTGPRAAWPARAWATAPRPAPGAAA